MNTVHLDTLLTIVDEGSFEHAALVLGISPSAVSQRIKALENETGRVLLHRTTPVTATAAGEVLVQGARRMALVEAEIQAQLRDRMSHVALAVAVNADSLATWFQGVLAKVAQWDNAALHLRTADESHTKALLRRGDVLGAVTTSAEPVSGCVAYPLGEMKYRATASPQLKERFTKENGDIDWARMPVLRYGPKDTLQDDDLTGRIDPAERRERRVSRIPSSEAFLEATRVGVGWALLPVQQAEHLVARGDLVYLDDRLQTVPLYWQRWRLQSALLERLTDAVLEAATELAS
ncbi:ArgP/LysG family DNA-binding transcriptional regulator [Corynebacterium poyangense]|uniref:ArgP/LysG family DNA-binding transcriptional regulator n=1 Tax=Corynebacterium poyangense TaxID=2684405 RepID=A0A7H0SNG8_9CORY|nr:LysR family transcriptional regulator ArgP [Corynebacterium poyangense]QNQ90093.1 ArgP/LysG family DNA-binding transcriptional regulator [Corynebacterium poyangense]